MNTTAKKTSLLDLLLTLLLALPLQAAVRAIPEAPPPLPKLASVPVPPPGSIVTFAWTASPDGTNVGGYFLYGSPMVTFLGTTNAQVKVDAGTNTQCSIANTNAGQWYFGVTAYPIGTNYNESVLSNILPVYFARPPANFYFLVPQYIATLGSTNWQDLGYFRLKIGPP